jgi:hypothetical protein
VSAYLSMVSRRTGGLVVVAIFMVGLSGCILPQGAAAGKAEEDVVCPLQAGHYQCELRALPRGDREKLKPNAEGEGKGEGEYGGIDPHELREAYKLPERGGQDHTIAIVDAGNDPDAESDLQIYRKKYDLYYKGSETACTEANHCFKKINQTGGKSFGGGEPPWGLEMSLDLDMASAICQECHILLVEADNSSTENMDLAEDEAASFKEGGGSESPFGFYGTTVISNSWGRPETSEETSRDTYFKHEGIPITVAAGDYGYGYGVVYPAASPNVIAVGGTGLFKKENSRGWSEEAWNGTGSGCSAYEKKPAWQPGVTDCSNRIDNDVSAVSSNGTPMSIYDTYEYRGWENVWGTSVASPIVAGVEALSSEQTRHEGAEAFYAKPASFFDVTEGKNGECAIEILCTAKVGYDGPTGLGTPDGVFGGPPLGEWRLGGTPLSKAVAVAWKGPIKLSVSGLGAKVECEETASGYADSGSRPYGEITTLSLSKCVYLETGKYCEYKGNKTELPTLTAEGLPWRSELATKEGTVRDVLSSVENPNKLTLRLKCIILKVGTESAATCIGALVATATNTGSDVTATFNPEEKLSCKPANFLETFLGKEISGSLEGSQLIEAAGGGKLEAEL